MNKLPRYPIYIPTKARADAPFTIRMFEAENIPFSVVVEPSQVEAYAEWKDRLVVLPENGKGLVYARNFINPVRYLPAGISFPYVTPIPLHPLVR